MEELHRYGLLSIACAIVLALTFTFRDREADAPLKPKAIHEKRDIAMAFEGGDDASATNGDSAQPEATPEAGAAGAADSERKLEQHASEKPKELGMKAPVTPNKEAKPESAPKDSKPSSEVASNPAKGEAAPKTTPVAKEEAAPSNEYVVKAGDTLTKIARAKLGDEKRYPEIVAANPTVNKNNLKPGMKLRMPSATKPSGDAAKVAKDASKADKSEKSAKNTPVVADSKSNADPKAKPANKTTPKKHTVAAGETLSSIARTYYNDAMAWKKIYDANKSKMKSATDIHKGMVLNLP